MSMLDHDDSKTNTGKKIPDDSPVDRTSAKRDSLTTNAGKVTVAVVIFFWES